MNPVLTLIFWLFMQFGVPNSLCENVDVESNHASCPVQFKALPPPPPPRETGREMTSFINNGF